MAQVGSVVFAKSANKCFRQCRQVETSSERWLRERSLFAVIMHSFSAKHSGHDFDAGWPPLGVRRCFLPNGPFNLVIYAASLQTPFVLWQFCRVGILFMPEVRHVLVIPSLECSFCQSKVVFLAITCADSGFINLRWAWTRSAGNDPCSHSCRVFDRSKSFWSIKNFQKEHDSVVMTCIPSPNSLNDLGCRSLRTKDSLWNWKTNPLMISSESLASLTLAFLSVLHLCRKCLVFLFAFLRSI